MKEAAMKLARYGRSDVENLFQLCQVIKHSFTKKEESIGSEWFSGKIYVGLMFGLMFLTLISVR